MKIHRAALVSLAARPAPQLPPTIATLQPEESDFLARHVDALRQSANQPQQRRAAFQARSDIPNLLGQLVDATPEVFIEVVAAIVLRLVGTMKVATNPKAGILVVATASDRPDEPPGIVSIMKLDADLEAAQWKALTTGSVQLSILKHLLPGPGSLQKGLSWPDPRPISDVIVQDRNLVNAAYFLSAYQVTVAPRASDAEETIHRALVQLPQDERPRALREASSLSGPANDVVATLRKHFPSLDASAIAATSGDFLPGMIRPGKLAALPCSLKADGITIVVPAESMDKVTITRVGGGWTITIASTSAPRWT